MEGPNKAEIKKQVEYYLSDANLKQDEYFYNIMKNSETHSVPIESLLNCNKLKKLNATRENILEAVADSEQVQINGDSTGIKRANDKDLPDFEPKPSKKFKSDGNGNGGAKATAAPSDEPKPFEPKVLKITLSTAEPATKWNEMNEAIEKATGVKPGYSRLNGTEGHIAVDKNNFGPEVQTKLFNTEIKTKDVGVKIEDCLDEDLKKFYADHGKHLDFCLERSGLKRKSKFGSKPQPNAVDFVFNNQRYTSLTNLRSLFKGILSKTSDDEVIGEADHKSLLELLKYHENFDEKARDLKHFTVGQHPSYKQTRCFFVVRNDGTREDFSSGKCVDAVSKKLNLNVEDEGAAN